MAIGSLTSAIATPQAPAAGIVGAQRDRAESASTSQTPEAAPSTTRVVFNPRSHYDASAGVFVMEFRSASTGEVERQFPDEQQLRAYQNARMLEAARAEGHQTQAPAAARALPSEDSATPLVVESKPPAAQAKTHQAVRIEV